MNRLTRWCHFPLFFFLVTPFFCVESETVTFVPTETMLLCVELGLHLAEHPLMKLVPIYMFSMGAGTKT